jgi:PIH1 N-terminal domain
MKEITKLDEKGEEQRGMHVPVAVGPTKQEIDKSGSPCEVVDVIIHPGVIEDCERDGTGQMQRFVVDLALQYVERKSGLKFSPSFVIPKGKKYHGATVTGQRIRKQTSRAGISEVSNNTTSTAGASNSKANSKSALSMLSEAGGIDGSVAGALVPAGKKGAAASAAPAVLPSSSLRRGEARPMDIRVLTPEEGDAKAAIAKEVGKTGPNGGVKGEDEDTTTSQMPSSAARIVGGSTSSSSSSPQDLLNARATTVKKQASSATTKTPAMVALDGVTAAINRAPLPVHVNVMAVVPAPSSVTSAGSEETTKSTLSRHGFIRLASSATIPLPSSQSSSKRSSDNQEEDDEKEKMSDKDNAAFRLYADEAKIWLSQLQDSQHVKSTSDATGEEGIFNVFYYPATATATPSNDSSDNSATTSSLIMTSEELLDHGIGTLIAAAFVPVTASLAAPAEQAPPAASSTPLPSTAISVSLSPDKKTLILSALGYQMVTIDLPWPSHAAAVAAANDSNNKPSSSTSKRVPVRYNPKTRLLSLYLPRDFSGLDAAKLPPLPVEALNGLLRSNTNNAAANTAESEVGDGSTAAASSSSSSLPAPYLRSLLRKYAEADSLSTAPEPGSRQWLLAHALSDGGLDDDVGAAKTAATAAKPAGTGTAATTATKVGVPGGPARTREEQGGDDEELPEDKFHRADALSLHFLKQKEDDKAARRQKDAEALAEKAKKQEEELLERARREVAEEKEKEKEQKANVKTVGEGGAEVATAAATASPTRKEKQAAPPDAIGLLPPSPASPAPSTAQVSASVASPAMVTEGPPPLSPPQDSSSSSASGGGGLKKKKKLVEML